MKLIGVQVSYRTVLNWINKYTALMEKYLDKITPQVSDTWRADELFLKVKGNMKYLYALMDDQTRFWIAQEVADTKNTADLRPLFKLGRKSRRSNLRHSSLTVHRIFTKRTCKNSTRKGGNQNRTHQRHRVRWSSTQQQDGAHERRTTQREKRLCELWKDLTHQS